MAHPNEDLVRETFAASGRGDIDALRNQYWASGMRLHYPGRSPLARQISACQGLGGAGDWSVVECWRVRAGVGVRGAW